MADQTISEEPLEVANSQLICGCATDALNLLENIVATDDSVKIVAAVDNAVFELQRKSDSETDANDEIVYLYGSLWGQQVVRELGWQWVDVVFHEQESAKAVAVVSPDRSLAIFPFNFVFDCIFNKASVTIALSFNMLLDGSKIPSLPSGGYENVMENVHHIVPRD